MLDEWLGRTVIRSCAKLTYAQAQMMLDGADDAGPDGPPLHCGYSWPQVRRAPVRDSSVRGGREGRAYSVEELRGS